MKMSCMRCEKVLALEVTTDDNETLSAEEDSFGGLPDKFQVDVAGSKGILLAVCSDCATAREAWKKLMQTTVQMLEVAEESISMHEMICSRIPAMADDPTAKAHYTRALEIAAHAREYLTVLLAAEPEGE